MNKIKKFVKNKNKGFTLVEVIVSVVLLAVTSTILFMALTGSVSTAIQARKMDQSKEQLINVLETGVILTDEDGNIIVNSTEIAATTPDKVIKLSFNKENGDTIVVNQKGKYIYVDKTNTGYNYIIFIPEGELEDENDNQTP